MRCNPSLAVTKQILELVESFSVTTNMDLSGETDAGVALVNAFNYISNNKEPYDALAFSTDVYSKGEDEDDVTLAEVRQIFRDSHGEEVTMDEVSDCTSES